MAEKKQHKIVSADTGEEVKVSAKKPTVKPAPAPADKSEATKKRIIAWVFWILALACEVVAILVLCGKINMTFMPQMWQLIILLVIDFALVVVGAQFWKKANRIDPASEANKLKFWLWNNMGVLVCCVAFIPFIILTLLNKEADKKTKLVATIVAAICLIAGMGLSADWNPVSQEGLAAAEETLAGQDVYWAPFGTVYHTHEDCQALNRSETLTQGNVDQAVEAGKTRLCKFCAKQDDITIDENGAISKDETQAAVEQVVEELIENTAESEAVELEPAA